MKISVVSPVYKGEGLVRMLVDRNSAVLRGMMEEKKITDYELVLVNDASPDGSWEEIEKACAQDKRVKGINLSRNFGQHYAITAGLRFATGDWIVVMDCDLQDRPEEIPNLFEKAQAGFDLVYARRVVRQDSYFKRLSSTVFHRVFDWLSGTKTDKTIANFGIYRKQVIDEFNKMPEKSRAFTTLLSYLGFQVGYCDVQHDERAVGETSYSLRKLLKLTFDILISNTNKPLHIAVNVGFGMSFVSFLLVIYNVLAKLLGIVEVEGYTSTIFSIWFVGGLLLLMMGVLGLYIDKIFEQVKDRPMYVVKQKINVEEKE